MGWGLITHSRKNQLITETEGIRTSINIGDATRALSSRMTLLGKSRKEEQKPTASFVNAKNKTTIRNWNVRTMFETGKAGQVAREMKRYKLDVLGISECRWRGSGKSKLNTGEVIIYSGEENIHQGGVAIMNSGKQKQRNWTLSNTNA